MRIEDDRKTHIEIKFSSFTNFAPIVQFTVHLTKDFVTNSETKTNSRSINALIELFNLSKDLEQFGSIFFFNTYSCVLYSKAHPHSFTFSIL